MCPKPSSAMKTISLIILLICSFDLKAQSFWKLSGIETHENALHSGILFSPESEAIFISTYNMGIFRSTDKGTSWDHVLNLPKDQPVTALFAAKNGTILGGGYGKIYRSETNGDKWEDISLDFTLIRSFAEDQNGYLYVCSTDSGGVLKSMDDGLTWIRNTSGLPSNYVNNIVGDGNGNIFCTLLTDEKTAPGGLFFWDEHQNQWVKKEIKVNIDNKVYLVNVLQILDIEFTPSSEIIISLEGIVSNFLVTGLYKNSVSGAIATTFWQQENWNDTISVPFEMKMKGIFTTTTGHLFANRKSNSSAGIYSKMSYSKQWISSDEGIPRTNSTDGYFCETPEGTVYLTTEFSNKLLVTKESEPGKKYFKISYQQLEPMKLYKYQTIHATSASGMDVSFKSMDNKTYIEGNEIRATGLGTALIKAYTDGNDSTYFSAQNITLSITKAENKIILEDPGILYEGDTSIYLNAYSDSGEEVFFKVIHGNAYFIKNRLIYNSPGKIKFIATEEGNGSYEQADTIRMDICITPKKPVISADTVSGTIRLISSSEVNNRWFLNNIFSGDTGKIISPKYNGIYTLQVMVDGCFSEFSEKFEYLYTGIDHVSDLKLNVYPIPFRDKLIIRKNLKENDILRMRYSIVDITGKILISGECKGDLTVLNLDGIKPGWYILNITQNQNSENFKILKSE